MKWIKLYSRLLLRYVQYFLKARTVYTIHAPFSYQLAASLLEDKRLYYAFVDIPLFKRGLLKNQNTIAIKDYGAGSLVNPSLERKISNIAKYSAISAPSGELLFKLVQFMKPRRMLELGTSLGISTAYQASAAQSAQFVSIEGCPQTALVAQQNLEHLGIKNVEVMQGTFEDRLPSVLSKLEQLDYLYVDGDHREGASLAYFNTCLPYLHENAVVVMADIHWSNEMESAWSTLMSHPKVSLSIDLFHFGLLFFRTEQKTKTRLSLIAAKYKPWQMGFFPSTDQ